MIQQRNSELDVEERFTRESNRLPERDLDRIANAYRDLLQSVGEEVDREGLQRTPDREARALEFLTQAIGRISRRSSTEPFSSPVRVRSSWSKTLSFIPF